MCCSLYWYLLTIRSSPTGYPSVFSFTANIVVGGNIFWEANWPKREWKSRWSLRNSGFCFLTHNLIYFQTENMENQIMLSWFPNFRGDLAKTWVPPQTEAPFQWALQIATPDHHPPLHLRLPGIRHRLKITNSHPHHHRRHQCVKPVGHRLKIRWLPVLQEVSTHEKVLQKLLIMVDTIVQVTCEREGTSLSLYGNYMYLPLRFGKGESGL